MGCGGSRLMDPERKSMAAKLPPRILHRFEEIRRRRNAAAMKGTLSKKDLLKESGDASQHSADDKSLSSPEESIRAARIAVQEPEPIKEEEDEEEEETGEEEEEERGRNIGDRGVCPGSPSFRVYCTEASEPIKDDSNDDDIDTEEKPQRDYSGETVASVNSNEKSEVKARKRGEKGKRLRKRKPNGGIKNLLNVKSCYHPIPSSTVHQNNTHLLAQKTAAA